MTKNALLIAITLVVTMPLAGCGLMAAMPSAATPISTVEKPSPVNDAIGTVVVVGCLGFLLYEGIANWTWRRRKHVLVNPSFGLIIAGAMIFIWVMLAMRK